MRILSIKNSGGLNVAMIDARGSFWLWKCQSRISRFVVLGAPWRAPCDGERFSGASLFVHALQELGEVDTQSVGDLGHVDEGDVAEARLDRRVI